MARGMIPYAYRSLPRSSGLLSPLHRCPAGLKLLGLLLVSTGAFTSIPGLGAAAIIVTAGAVIAGIRPWELLRGSKTVLFLATFTTIIRALRFGRPELNNGSLAVLNMEGFWGGLHQGLCFIISFAAGALLFSVTTMQELRDSLGRFEAAAINRFLALPHFFRTGRGKALPPKRRVHSRFSLGLSLMLGFLPRFFEIWETANLAFEARAGKQGPGRFIILIPLTIERMLEMAGETADALDSRGLSLVV